MNRRHLLEAFIGLAGCTLAPARGEARGSKTRPVRMNINMRNRLGQIPDDFTGLGYEISSIAIAGLLSDKNRANVQLVRGLGARGVMRIGGITSDSAFFAHNAAASPDAKATVINAANLSELAGFLDATGWKLIWGLNLGDGDRQNAVAEAVAVAAAVKDKLLAFEIGNEPDGFGGGRRPKGYSYDDYLKEYRDYKAIIRGRLPNAPFAGPDASYATDWVTRFASDEGSDLRLLTRHYYRAGANNPYLDTLLNSAPYTSPDRREAYAAQAGINKINLLLQKDPGLDAMTQELSAAASATHVPYRICEMNTLFGGGQPSVSDVFASALWVLDFMCTLAQAGCAGVNVQTGINHLDFVSYYSPIRNDQSGTPSVAPEYYGMLAFAQASGGECLALDRDAGGVNLTAYAVQHSDRRLSVAVINKDANIDADVSISADRSLRHAAALRLTGRALDRADGVTLGGASVASDGRWQPKAVEALHVAGGSCEVHVPAASAAIVKWSA
jgi:Glycosyl hydrolase family 79 C-terminal beta domain